MGIQDKINPTYLQYDEKITELNASSQQQQHQQPTSCFQHHQFPYLAVITEPDACDSDKRMAQTIQAMSSAVSTGKVALISVRIVQPNNLLDSAEFEKRVVRLTVQLVNLSKQYSFQVVVSSDWINAALQAGAHGVHVKERHQSRIPETREKFAAYSSTSPLIGTSAHDVSSALDATSMYHPDYFFVGTCYPTESHPTKTQLEGPTLPGEVRRRLAAADTDARPIVFAIGGINADNCAQPVVQYGADGVAVIRSVLQASDPARAVMSVVSNMR